MKKKYRNIISKSNEMNTVKSIQTIFFFFDACIRTAMKGDARDVKKKKRNYSSSL